MSTSPQLGKKLRNLVKRPTVLEAAVGATVRGLSEEDLLAMVVMYSNCNAGDNLSGLAQLVLRALGEIHIDGEATLIQEKAIRKASAELHRSRAEFRAAMTWLCSPKASTPVHSGRQLSAKLEWGRHPLIDKTSEDFVKYFEKHGLNHFRCRLSLQQDRLLLVPTEYCII